MNERITQQERWQSTATQYRLSPERQLCLDGTAEPLVEHGPTPDRSPETRLGAQNGLFDGCQLPLPLPPIHPPKDGKVSPECNEGRGFHASTCPEHPEEIKVHAHVCGLQKCSSSQDANSKERARDAWDGTADQGERVGLRNFNVPWGIFVWTLPDVLRGACVGQRLKKFRRAAQEMTQEVLRRHGAGEAEFYGRSWLHPVGDQDPETYKPHENVLVPLVFFRGGKAHRLRTHLPSSWLGAAGWVGELWRDKLVAIFGQWWASSSPAPTVNWFFEYRERIEQKKHALRYFARVFPSWAGHKDVSCRPRSWGLAHWKKKELLLELVDQLEPELEFGSCPRSTPEYPCPPALAASADTEQRTVEALAGLVEQYRHGESSYLETRRIMRVELERQWRIRSLEPPVHADCDSELAANIPSPVQREGEAPAIAAP